MLINAICFSKIEPFHITKVYDIQKVWCIDKALFHALLVPWTSG